MPEAHVKPCYMLETPKTQGATDAKILEDEAMAEMGKQQVTQIEIGWLAGMIDGEGYLGFQAYKTRNNHRSVSVELSITNTDEQMILRLQNILQRIGVNPYINNSTYKIKHKPTHKNVWKIVLHRMNKVLKVLEIVNPYLTGQKQERGKLVLEYCQSRLVNYIPGSHHNIMTKREARIVELCIAKQKRGTSETIRKAQLENSELQRQKTESRRNKINGRFLPYKNCDDIVRPFVKA